MTTAVIIGLIGGLIAIAPIYIGLLIMQAQTRREAAQQKRELAEAEADLKAACTERDHGGAGQLATCPQRAGQRR